MCRDTIDDVGDFCLALVLVYLSFHNDTQKEVAEKQAKGGWVSFYLHSTHVSHAESIEGNE